MQALIFSPYPEETAVLTVVLQQTGMIVRTIKDFSAAIGNWPDNPADFILIVSSDDGTAILKQLRQLRGQTLVPILVIVNLLSEDSQVKLMEAGADLVLGRPYGVRLLLAHVKSLLRRSAGVPFHSLPTLTQADLLIDPSSRTVTIANGFPKRLTHLEFRLLYTLITHPGQIIPAENLVEYVWGYSGDGNRELVRGLIQRLRSKIEIDPRKPRYVVTEPGIGYFFNPEANNAAE